METKKPSGNTRNLPPTRLTRPPQQASLQLGTLLQQIRTRTMTDEERTARAKREEKLRDIAASLDATVAQLGLASARANVSKSIDQAGAILENLIGEVQEAADVLCMYEEKIAELHDKELIASGIEDLILRFKLNSEDFQRRAAERDEIWKKQERDYLAARKAEQEETARAERLKQEDLDRAHRLQEEDFAARKAKLEEREKVLVETETNLETRLKDRLEAELKQIEAAYQHRKSCYELENQAKLQLALARAEAAEAALRSEKETTAKLTESLRESELRVTEIARGALDSASGQRALTEVSAALTKRGGRDSG